MFDTYEQYEKVLKVLDTQHIKYNHIRQGFYKDMHIFVVDYKDTNEAIRQILVDILKFEKSNNINDKFYYEEIFLRNNENLYQKEEVKEKTVNDEFIGKLKQIVADLSDLACKSDYYKELYTAGKIVADLIENIEKRLEMENKLISKKKGGENGY